jgi:hypothetical protein
MGLPGGVLGSDEAAGPIRRAASLESEAAFGNTRELSSNAVELSLKANELSPKMQGWCGDALPCAGVDFRCGSAGRVFLLGAP